LADSGRIFWSCSGGSILGLNCFFSEIQTSTVSI
jgi:hypothetical protein